MDGEVVAVFVIALILAALFGVAIYFDAAQEAELHAAYVNMCAVDTMKADPTMTRADAEQKCEVLYAMEKKRRPKDVNIVWVLH